MDAVLPLLREYLRIADLVKLRRVHRDLEWDHDTALVVAMKLHHAKLIPNAKIRELRQWTYNEAFAGRVFRLCTSSRNYRGKCSECLGLIPPKYGHWWRYCKTCLKTDPSLRSKWEYWC